MIERNEFELKRIGETLKKKRLEKKIEIKRAHSDTRLSVNYIIGMEQGDIHAFPAEIYYLGSLKKYAEYLEINPAELVDGYINSKIYSEKDIVEIPQRRKNKAIYYVLTAFLAAGSVYAGFMYNEYRGLKNRQSVKTEIPNEKEPAPVEYKLNLDVKSRKGTWLRVISDGETAFENIVRPGTKNGWKAMKTIKLKIGYAPGIEVNLNGRRIYVSTSAAQPQELVFNAVNNITATATGRELGKTKK